MPLERIIFWSIAIGMWLGAVIAAALVLWLWQRWYGRDSENRPGPPDPDTKKPPS